MTKKFSFFIWKFFTMCSPTKSPLSGIIPFIPEIITLFEISTLILWSSEFINSDGTTRIITSAFSATSFMLLLTCTLDRLNSTELK